MKSCCRVFCVSLAVNISWQCLFYAYAWSKPIYAFEYPCFSLKWRWRHIDIYIQLKKCRFRYALVGWTARLLVHFNSQRWPFQYLLLLLLLLTAGPLHADWLDINAYVVVLNPANLSVLEYRAMAANFGTDLPDFGLRGRLQETVPRNACSPVRPAPKPLVNDSGALPWMALIRRSAHIKNCTFDLKVLHAQMAGYKAAVVYNNLNNRIITMQSGKYAFRVHIPSVFIGYDDYRDLRDNWINLPKYKVELHTTFNSNIYLIPFLAVVSTSLAIIVVFFVVKWCRDYRRRQRSRLSKRHLKKLSQKKFCVADDPYECCAICLEDYEEGDQLRILPCNHAFHAKCVDPWLLKNKRNCPVCKRKIFSNKKCPARSAGWEPVGSASTAGLSAATSSGSDSNSEADLDATTTTATAPDCNERTPLLGASAALSRSATYSSEPASVEEVLPPNSVTVGSNHNIQDGAGGSGRRVVVAAQPEVSDRQRQSNVVWPLVVETDNSLLLPWLAQHRVVCTIVTFYMVLCQYFLLYYTLIFCYIQLIAINLFFEPLSQQTINCVSSRSLNISSIKRVNVFLKFLSCKDCCKCLYIYIYI